MPSRSVEQTTALANSCLASRTFHAIATPILYRDLDFAISERAPDFYHGHLRADLYCCAVEEGPELGAYCRSLTFEYTLCAALDWWYLSDITALMPMLDELNVIDGDGASLLRMAADLCSRVDTTTLRSLRIVSYSRFRVQDLEWFLSRAFGRASRLEVLALGGSIGDKVQVQEALRKLNGFFPLKEINLDLRSIHALPSLSSVAHSVRRIDLTIPCYHDYIVYRSSGAIAPSVDLSIFPRLEDVHLSLGHAPEMQQLVGGLESCTTLKTFMLSTPTTRTKCACSPYPDDYLQLRLTCLPATISKIDLTNVTLPPVVLIDLLNDSHFDRVDIGIPSVCGHEVEMAARERWWRRVEAGGRAGPYPRSAVKSLLYDSEAEQESVGGSEEESDDSALESGAADSSVGVGLGGGPRFAIAEPVVERRRGCRLHAQTRLHRHSTTSLPPTLSFSLRPFPTPPSPRQARRRRPPSPQHLPSFS